MKAAFIYWDLMFYFKMPTHRHSDQSWPLYLFFEYRISKSEDYLLLSQYFGNRTSTLRSKWHIPTILTKTMGTTLVHKKIDGQIINYLFQMVSQNYCSHIPVSIHSFPISHHTGIVKQNDCVEFGSQILITSAPSETTGPHYTILYNVTVTSHLVHSHGLWIRD